LIDKLVKNTNSGKLEWQKTSRDTEFKADFLNGAVSTDAWEYDKSSYCDIRLYNSRGDIVSNWQYTSDEEEYKIIKKLYDTVLMKYLKVDETIDGILNELS
jgi:hypothetical protein